MPRLEASPETYFTTVRGMCRQCRQVVPARVFFRDGSVWQESLCPRCEPQAALIAGDQNWYLDHVLTFRADHSPLPASHAPEHGCPLDCGPCAWHATPCQLPVLSVTNACELRCPICFTYNRRDPVWHMSVEELRATLDWVVESSGPVDLVNLTGGEPTLHPRITDLLRACQRPEIGRITMNSNGLRLSEDEDLCREIAELGVHVVLSFSALDSEVGRQVHGADVVAAKLRALENLSRAGAKLTLLCVLIRGLNEDVPGRILDMMRTNERILSLTVQTMAYTGQGGGSFPDRRHIPVDEATRMVCEHSGGMLRPDDFAPRPSAHPLCYAVSYLLRDGESFVPFARFASPELLDELMADSYLLRMAGREDVLRDILLDLYSRAETGLLQVFRSLVADTFPASGPLEAFEQQEAAEGHVRTVYIHAHMDEDNFDCSRAMSCPDLVPSRPGRLIPACTYNLFDRMQDERFYCADQGHGAEGGPE